MLVFGDFSDRLTLNGNCRPSGKLRFSVFTQNITGNVVRVLVQRHADSSLHTSGVQEGSGSENLLAAQTCVVLKQTCNNVARIRNIDQHAVETGFFQSSSDLLSLLAVKRVFQKTISAVSQRFDISESSNDDIGILQSLVVIH